MSVIIKKGTASNTLTGNNRIQLNNGTRIGVINVTKGSTTTEVYRANIIVYVTNTSSNTIYVECAAAGLARTAVTSGTVSKSFSIPFEASIKITNNTAAFTNSINIEAESEDGLATTNTKFPNWSSGNNYVTSLNLSYEKKVDKLMNYNINVTNITTNPKIIKIATDSVSATSLLSGCNVQVGVTNTYGTTTKIYNGNSSLAQTIPAIYVPEKSTITYSVMNSSSDTSYIASYTNGWTYSILYSLTNSYKTIATLSSVTTSTTALSNRMRIRRIGGFAIKNNHTSTDGKTTLKSVSFDGTGMKDWLSEILFLSSGSSTTIINYKSYTSGNANIVDDTTYYLYDTGVGTYSGGLIDSPFGSLITGHKLNFETRNTISSARGFYYYHEDGPRLTLGPGPNPASVYSVEPLAVDTTTPSLTNINHSITHTLSTFTPVATVTLLPINSDTVTNVLIKTSNDVDFYSVYNPNRIRISQTNSLTATSSTNRWVYTISKTSKTIYFEEASYSTSKYEYFHATMTNSSTVYNFRVYSTSNTSVVSSLPSFTIPSSYTPSSSSYPTVRCEKRRIDVQMKCPDSGWGDWTMTFKNNSDVSVTCYYNSKKTTSSLGNSSRSSITVGAGATTTTNITDVGGFGDNKVAACIKHYSLWNYNMTVNSTLTTSHVKSPSSSFTSLT